MKKIFYVYGILFLVIVGFLTSCGSGGSSSVVGTGIVLESITIGIVNGSNNIIPAGTTTQLIANGSYSDGSVRNITDQVIWKTNSESVTVNSQGIALGVSPGIMLISAHLGNVYAESSIILIVTNATLESITIGVVDGNHTVPLGAATQLVAHGSYSDGNVYNITNQVIWNSNTESLTINANGVAVGISPCISVISAHLGNIYAESDITLVVTNAHLESITIGTASGSHTIAVGTTTQMFAYGSYSDGSVRNITDQVTWDSNTESVTVNLLGVALGVSPCTSIIGARLESVSATSDVTLVVTNATLLGIQISGINSQISTGLTTSYSAVGIFSDNSIQDITNDVTWSSTALDVATVESDGVATGVAPGDTSIMASRNSINSNQIALSVIDATVESITITPESSTLNPGITQSYTATALMSNYTTQNITNSVIWASSNEDVATIDSRGIATAIAANGVTSITAKYGAITSNASTLIASTAVTLSSISILPDPAVIIPTISEGTGTLQLEIIGHYSDGSTSQLSNGIWSIVDQQSPSGESVVDSVSFTGLVTAADVSESRYQTNVGNPTSNLTYQGGYADISVLYYVPGISTESFTATTKVYVGNFICYPESQFAQSCTCMQDTTTKNVWLTVPYNTPESWIPISTYANNLNVANGGSGTCGFDSGWDLPSLSQFNEMISYVPAIYFVNIDDALVYTWFQGNGFPELQGQGYWGQCVGGSANCPVNGNGNGWHLNPNYGIVYKDPQSILNSGWPIHPAPQ